MIGFRRRGASIIETLVVTAIVTLMVGFTGVAIQAAIAAMHRLAGLAS